MYHRTLDEIAPLLQVCIPESRENQTLPAPWETAHVQIRIKVAVAAEGMGTSGQLVGIGPTV
jgi:hypothetical protein